MFSRRDLQELAEYKGTGKPVLSLYLNVDPSQHTTDEYKLTLRRLLHDAGEQAAGEDVAAIERFFDLEYDWSGRGVAVLSCAADKFWRAFPLAVPVADHVFVGPKPYLTPLAKLWDTFGRFVVTIVDKQGAKLLLFHVGELIRTEGVIGETVRRVKAGGGSAEKGRRGGTGATANKHEDQVAARNLKEAAELTVAFCEANQPRNLLLGGKAETLKLFRSKLPRVWADRVIGTFAADMGIHETEVRDKALKILDEVEREREAALSDAVITAAAKGKSGVVRLDDTLSAAHEGRVQTLLVAEGYKAEGFQCPQCAYVTGQQLDRCPFCGGTMERIPDAIEAIIQQVLEQGGHVELVAGHKELNAAGVGALLRY
jgi:peptide subunit release factor 1 (eRF1)